MIGASQLAQEVAELVKREGLSVDSQPGRCIGYRQTLEYLRDVWKFPLEGGEGNAPIPQVCVCIGGVLQVSVMRCASGHTYVYAHTSLMK